MRADPAHVACACPDCHRLHEVQRCYVGGQFWDVCPSCLEVEDQRLAQVLRERGIVLVRA
jgi:hypothetical protein